MARLFRTLSLVLFLGLALGITLTGCKHEPPATPAGSSSDDNGGDDDGDDDDGFTAPDSVLVN
ncbi:MAG: hypothetical protein JNL05_00200 [Flavobacteriales bacterium]|jgi:hypothetical protein|nr:hypothetical protein [Flavobacteriales bacterium]